jgi:hypothetical protein
MSKIYFGGSRHPQNINPSQIAQSSAQLSPQVILCMLAASWRRSRRCCMLPAFIVAYLLGLRSLISRHLAQKSRVKPVALPPHSTPVFFCALLPPFRAAPPPFSFPLVRVRSQLRASACALACLCSHSRPPCPPPFLLSLALGSRPLFMASLVGSGSRPFSYRLFSPYPASVSPVKYKRSLHATAYKSRSISNVSHG